MMMLIYEALADLEQVLKDLFSHRQASQPQPEREDKGKGREKGKGGGRFRRLLMQEILMNGYLSGG